MNQFSLFLGPFGTILRAGLHAVGNACAVKSAADDVVTNARQVFYAAAADHYYRVLLQIVANTRNVGSYLELVGQPDSGDFAKS